MYEADRQGRLFPESESTHRNYEAQWNRFVEWASDHGISHALPLEPSVVVRYLDARRRGNITPAWNREIASPAMPGTLRVATAAIAYRHRRLGMADPCSTIQVRSALERLASSSGDKQKHATPLDKPAFDRIRETVTEPRIGRSGKLERRRTALRRGLYDIALIGVMRDALLRVAEAAELKWEEIVEQDDGSGRIALPNRSRSQESTLCSVSVETMRDLDKIRGRARDSVQVFNMTRSQITSRIRRAADQAGLTGRFDSNSPRIGMVLDMHAAGASLYEIQQAGRWGSLMMPARYLGSQRADSLAVDSRHNGGQE